MAALIKNDINRLPCGAVVRFPCTSANLLRISNIHPKNGRAHGRHMGVSMSGWIEKHCEWCGKTMEARIKEINRGWGRFCSRSCGSKNTCSNKPPAKSTSRLNHLARKAYIGRHGEPSCENCGVMPADIHHLNKNLRDNQDENLMALCRSCHVRYHDIVAPKRRAA